MSMSQEEIEALMNGAESIELDEAEEELSNEEQPNEVTQDVENSEELTQKSEEIENDDINDILAGIDGIVDDSSGNESKEELPQATSGQSEKEEAIEDLIESNQYPLPVKNENKVVNQLNEVADDSEEKASQIFDVLSFILDENNEIQNYNNKIGEFITSQVSLMDALSKKFPNIDVFSDNLKSANELVETTKALSSKIDGENNKVFEAMELMQYHDINRQKIERVMAVIRKLNSYLNGIFEDDNERPEVQIAKHISGDSNAIVGADDIDSLISEFSNEG